jgi:hypothetical protein
MKQAPLLQLFAFAVPAMGNLLAVAVWLPLLRVEPGGAIRPMRESFYTVLVAAIALAFGVAVAAPLIKRGQSWLGGFCLLGSLTPLFVGLLTADAITQWKGLVWAP